MRGLVLVIVHHKRNRESVRREAKEFAGMEEWLGLGYPATELRFEIMGPLQL